MSAAIDRFFEQEKAKARSEGYRAGLVEFADIIHGCRQEAWATSDPLIDRLLVRLVNLARTMASEGDE